MASNSSCWRLLDCFRSRHDDNEDEDEQTEGKNAVNLEQEQVNPTEVCPKGKMTFGSSTIDRRVSPPKSKFSKFKASLPFFKRHYHVPDGIKSEEVLLTFQQNLHQHQFAVAGKQLISEEEHLFALKQERVGSNKSMLDEVEKDFEDFLKEVLSTVENSLDIKTKEENESLREAVLAIEQEEEQDRRWEGVDERERPSWRPRCCRRTHDSLIQNMVTRRMEEANLNLNINIRSSVQVEITGKGKQLKEDLLQVAKNVRGCYPRENVCQLYAKLYHQVFSAKLMEITDYGLDDDDCLHVLQWVNNYYPKILRHEELSGVIEYEQLEALLPDNILEPLEEQFLTNKEVYVTMILEDLLQRSAQIDSDNLINELQTWCQNALSREEKADPELRDNCYFSPLAIDVIECVHGVLTSAKEVLGSWSKPQRITHQLKEFLCIYQHFLEKVIEDNQVNTDAVLKANLHCIREFRNYIIKNPDPFPEHVKNDCIHLLTTIRDTCHGYFTKPIHKDLKGRYTKLGSQEWLKHNEHVCSELLEGVGRHIQEIRNLDQTCLKELVSQLHLEVLAEYVRKMMKKKLKLKEEKKQHQAAEALCKNSQKIHTLFTEAGSNMNGLEDILPKLAELLTLNDPQCIELQLVSLSRIYPDLSEAHVSAWLHLKANLSPSDLKKIRETFSEFQDPKSSGSTVDGQVQDPLHSSSYFFSKVAIK